MVNHLSLARAEQMGRPCRGHSHEGAPTLAGNADIAAILTQGC